MGISDDAWGERVVACVVRQRDEACDAPGLRAFVRARLAPYKVPKEIIFLTDLPKNALGKVVKPLPKTSAGKPAARAFAVEKLRVRAPRKPSGTRSLK